MSDDLNTAGRTTFFLRLGHLNGLGDRSRCLQLVTAVELRRDGERIVASSERGGDEEDQLRRLVEADGTRLDPGLGALAIGQGDADRRVVAHHLDVLAREGEVRPRGGVEQAEASGGVEAGGEVHRRALLADDVDHHIGDRLAQLLALGEVDVDLVRFGIPRRAVHEAPALRHGLEEPVVDAHAVEEQAFDGPFLEIEDEAHHLRLDARVHVHHLGDDPFLVGRAEGDDNEDLVVRVVLGDGVVRDLHVDLVLDVVCHNNIMYLGAL